MNIFLNLLIAQGLMGAADTLWHHEFTEDLPHRHGAGKELGIHGIRALFYALVFISLAWLEWHGYWVYVLVSIILLEVALTLYDFVIEDRTRMLPASERIMHTLLAINGGAVFMLLALELPAWFAETTAFIQVNHGWKSWLLTLFGIGVALSGMRDLVAARNAPLKEVHMKFELDTHRHFLISGGTGFIGSTLCRQLLSEGHTVTLLTRKPQAANLQFQGNMRAIPDTTALAADTPVDVVINLAGAPVLGMPWTRGRRKTLLDSRLNTTENLLRFVRRAECKPALWIQASAIGYYGTDPALVADEDTPAGKGFAADLCKQWEEKIAEVQALNTRCVTLRLGVIAGRSGGALPRMLLPYRFGLGSIIGSGQQHFAWLHLEDLMALFAKALTDEQMQGVYNAVAPECPDYRRLAKLSGELMHRPVFLKLPASLLNAALGEMATLLTGGPQVKPAKLQQEGFNFRFATLRAGLMDII